MISNLVPIQIFRFVVPFYIDKPLVQYSEEIWRKEKPIYSNVTMFEVKFLKP